MDYTAQLFLIGRVLLGGYFLMGGYSHFSKLDMMAGYAGSKGTPSPKLAVAVSGLLLLIGGLGILFGINVRWAVLALVLFLVPVTFMMHAFWKATDPMQKMAERIQFMKNMALLGAVLMLLAIPTPWVYGLGQ